MKNMLLISPNEYRILKENVVDKLFEQQHKSHGMTGWNDNGKSREMTKDEIRGFMHYIFSSAEEGLWED